MTWVTRVCVNLSNAIMSRPALAGRISTNGAKSVPKKNCSGAKLSPREGGFPHEIRTRDACAVDSDRSANLRKRKKVLAD